MNWFLAGRSLKYFMFSRHKNGHGIHSPFVYSIIKDVFKNKTSLALVSLVEKTRKEYRKDKRTIAVNDLGAGSLKLQKRERRISDIAKYASVRPHYGALLSRLASVIDGRTIIEMGTSLGIGTMYLALGAPSSKVITIEGCKNISSIAKTNFSDNKVENIESVTGNFDDVLDVVLKGSGKIGLVYIDGNHRSDALLRYMDLLYGFINEDTIIVVDDIHYSSDMEQGWDTLKESDSVILSVDILQMGLLFFRKGMRKQDFVIRY
jgi:predicted O-methyltransferase YrrM